MVSSIHPNALCLAIFQSFNLRPYSVGSSSYCMSSTSKTSSGVLEDSLEEDVLGVGRFRCGIDLRSPPSENAAFTLDLVRIRENDWTGSVCRPITIFHAS